MYRVFIRYDDNLYKEPKSECKGWLEFNSVSEAIENIARIVNIQDTLIERNSCYSPYTHIALYKDDKWILGIEYTYRKGVNPASNRNFRKEIHASSEHYYREIKRQVHNRDI